MPKVRKKSGGEVEVEAGTPLREVTKENGWPVAYGCENGVCGTCVIKVNENGLNPKTETEAVTLEMMCMDEDGYRLACQCKVEGDTEIEIM